MQSPDKKLGAYPLDWFYAQHHSVAVLHRSGIVTDDSGIVTDDSGIVTDDSGITRKSVTFVRNGRSRCAGISGHVRPESAVTLIQNTQLHA
jgi:hypothetical protein